MKIEIEFPDLLPEGHGASFKKGIAEVLIANAKTDLSHTPNGHESSRRLGERLGEKLVAEISKVVKQGL